MGSKGIAGDSVVVPEILRYMIVFRRFWTSVVFVHNPKHSIRTKLVFFVIVYECIRAQRELVEMRLIRERTCEAKLNLAFHSSPCSQRFNYLYFLFLKCLHGPIYAITAVLSSYKSFWTCVYSLLSFRTLSPSLPSLCMYVLVVSRWLSSSPSLVGRALVYKCHTDMHVGLLVRKNARYDMLFD